MPEREVQKIAAEKLRPMNQGLISLGSATSFEDYVEGTYKPVVLPLMAKSTRERSEKRDCTIPEAVFGTSPLRDLTPLTVQRFLSGMADSPLSHESKDKVRDVLSAVLGSAVQYGLLVKNPVEGLKLPPPKTGPEVEAVRHSAAVARAGGVDRRAIRKHGFRGRVHRPEANRTGGPAVAQCSFRFHLHRRAVLPRRLGRSEERGQQRDGGRYWRCDRADSPAQDVDH